MIQETIVTTQNLTGQVHIAPMGIHVEDDVTIIQPFKPSTTLNNLLETRVAVINYCNDVRVFAGCLTGRKNWPLKSAQQIQGQVLAYALAHAEVEIERIDEDELRPKLFCKTLCTINHAPFKGFNRAQFSVLEAAILISRLGMLPMEKIETEIAYLKIGLDKTAGEYELEAWSWLLEALENFKNKASQ